MSALKGTFLRHFKKICFKLYFSVVLVLFIHSFIYLLAYFDLFIFVTRLTLYSFCRPGGPELRDLPTPASQVLGSNVILPRLAQIMQLAIRYSSSFICVPRILTGPGIIRNVWHGVLRCRRRKCPLQFCL